MKTLVVAFSLWLMIFIAQPVYSQLHLGQNGSALPISPVRAGIETIYFEGFSFDFWVSSNTSKLSAGNFNIFEASALREKVLGTSGNSTGWGGIYLNGPSVSIPINRKTSVGIVTKARLQFNYWDVSGRLVSEIGELTKTKQLYPFHLTSNSMKMDLVLFSEFGLNLSHVFNRDSRNRFTGGFSIKLLNPVSHTSLDLRSLEGDIVKVGPDLTYLTNATGSVRTLTSGVYINELSLLDLLRINNPSVSADLGILYEHFETSSTKPNMFFGLTVRDIGSLSFVPHESYSSIYNIKIPEKKYLFFNENFDNAKFDRITEVFDKHSDFFNKQLVVKQPYRVQLPALVFAEFHLNLFKKYSFNTHGTFPITRKKSSNILYHHFSVCLTPGWKPGKYKFDVYMPVRYQKLNGVSVGLGFNVAGFYIISNSLIPLLSGKSRLVDLSVGFTLNKF